MTAAKLVYDLPEPPSPVVAPIWKEDEDGSNRHVTNAADGVLWSGPLPVPASGTKVDIKMNHLGTGTIVGYFVEHGWLGVKVKLDTKAEWYPKGAKFDGFAFVFGAEIRWPEVT